MPTRVRAADRGAAAAGLALVAGRRDVLEVDAAGALQRVAAGGGHVAQLAGGAGEQGLGEHRVALADPAVGRELAVGDGGADAAGRRRGVSLISREVTAGTSTTRPGVATPSLRWSTRLVPPPRKTASGRSGDGGDGRVGVGGAGEGERLHAARPPPAAPPGRCWRRRRSGRGCRSSARRPRASSSSGSAGEVRRDRARPALRDLVEHARPRSRSARACSSRTGRRRGRGRPAARGAARRPSASPSAVVISAPSCATASARQVRVRRPSSEHRAGAALAVVAALLRAGVAEALAQQVEQRRPGVDGQRCAPRRRPAG